ncbi:MAG: hypothetical protein JJE44_06765 [Flavobacteriaceae bacterium]|nr:hypothetical protein [Flavobacteriaceae bacterium]
MTRSIFTRYVLPFTEWLALMILITIAADYFLHRMQIVSVGRYLGPIGTFVIIISFVYSLRKRKIIEYGSPKKLLLAHEYMAWVGSIMILIHGGIHFNALFPWLAILMLIIAVASGLVGKFLLKKANETFKEKLKVLVDTGITKEEAEKKLFFDSITVDLMKKWRIVHLPITLLLGIFSLIHIITEIMFSK